MSGVTRVLGVDPGLRIAGWGVVELEDGGLRHLASGTIRPDPEAPIAARLAHLHQGLTQVLAEHRPQAAAVEEAFGGKNVRSAIRLGEARAVAILAAHQAACAVHEVPPALVKKAVAGHGRASKEAVREAVLRALDLAAQDPPRAFDETDALALALTAIGRLQALGGGAALVEGLPIGRRGRGGGRGGRRGRWSTRDLEGLVGREE